MLVNEVIATEDTSRSNTIRTVARELNIPFAIAMELANKESPHGQFDKSGNTIVGDKHLKNKAYGLGQVRLTALNDVNRIYGTEFSMDDIKNNTEKNARVALMYFNAQRDQYGATGLVQQLRGYNGGPGAIDGSKPNANQYADDVYGKAMLNYTADEDAITNEASPWELLKRKVTPVVQKNKYQRVAEKLHAMLLRKQKENGGVFRHALGWYTYNIGTSYKGIDHKVLHQYYLDNFDAVVD